MEPSSVGKGRDLARAVEAGAVVRALERVGFTQTTLAWATGANERSVRNWRTTSAIRPKFDERLREVQEIAHLLEDTLTPHGIAQWFTARNRLLGGRRPGGTAAWYASRTERGAWAELFRHFLDDGVSLFEVRRRAGRADRIGRFFDALVVEWHLRRASHEPR